MADVPVSVDVTNKLPAAHRPAKQLAKRVTTLLTEGKTTDEIADELHLPKSMLNAQQLRAKVKEVLAAGYLPAEVQRAALRAGRFQAFMTMLGRGLEPWTDGQGRVHAADEGALKLAAEFSAQIGRDPEIGLSQPPQVVVNLEFGDVKEVIRKAEPLPGFAAPVFLDDEEGEKDGE